jgi:hypothetical protein
MRNTVPLIVLLAVLGAAPAFAADRARVATACTFVGDNRFAYDCTFKITNARTGAPIDNAEVTIGADMPSMPMAHNVRPVVAKPTGVPGEYAAQLVLEMYGDWALRVRITGPLRDQIVDLKNFGEEGAGPPSRRAGTPKRGGHHKH